MKSKKRIPKSWPVQPLKLGEQAKNFPRRKAEHLDDHLDRVLTDPFADVIKGLALDGVPRAAILRAIRNAMLNGWTEYRMAKGIPEDEAFESAAVFADDVASDDI